MPKKKTKKSFAKRCKVTSTGKVILNKAGRSHLLSNKSRKRKRHMRRGQEVHHADLRRMKTLLD
jgi:large subunit ribosomal protein L35